MLEQIRQLPSPTLEQITGDDWDEIAKATAVSLKQVYLGTDVKQSQLPSNSRSSTAVCLTAFDPETTRKFLLLCASLLSVMSLPMKIRLGALGSHLLEHFFGRIRRLSHGDNRDSTFRRQARNIFVENLLASEIGYCIRITKRVSDSGANLEDEVFDRSLLNSYNWSMTLATDLITSIERIIPEGDDPNFLKGLIRTAVQLETDPWETIHGMMVVESKQPQNTVKNTLLCNFSKGVTLSIPMLLHQQFKDAFKAVEDKYGAGAEVQFLQDPTEPIEEGRVSVELTEEEQEALLEEVEEDLDKSL